MAGWFHTIASGIRGSETDESLITSECKKITDGVASIRACLIKLLDALGINPNEVTGLAAAGEGEWEASLPEALDRLIGRLIEAKEARIKAFRAIAPQVNKALVSLGMLEEAATDVTAHLVSDTQDALAALAALVANSDVLANLSMSMREQQKQCLKEIVDRVLVNRAEAEGLMKELDPTTSLGWPQALHAVLEVIRRDIGEIEDKYAMDAEKGFVKRLRPFAPHDYLKAFAGNAFEVHDGSRAPTPARKDHILCNLMDCGQRMLRSLAKTVGEKNLPESYDASARAAAELTDAPGSILWFSNMKRPSTYVRSRYPTPHCKAISLVLHSKRLVDARRVHLFHNRFADPTIRKQNGEAYFLLGTMLAEYLSGIESRVLWISDLEQILPGAEAGKKIGPLYLLDYALCASADRDRGGASSEQSNGFSILCSDFTAEADYTVEPGPSYHAEVERDQAIALRVYENERVYPLREPTLLPLFRQHFLALWDVKGYASRIRSAYPDPDPDSEELRAQVAALEAAARNVGLFEFMEFLGAKDAAGNDCLLDAFKRYPYDLMDMPRNEVEEAMQAALAMPTIERVKKALAPIRLRSFPWEGGRTEEAVR